MRSRVFALSLFAVAGCDDALKPVDVVQEPRVLAARMEVEGAPERQSPAPGETAHVRWLVAAPDGDPQAGFALAVCSTVLRGRSLECDGAPFASVSAEAGAEPRLDFVVPSALDVSQRPDAALLGVLCPGANGVFDAGTPRCTSGEPLPVRLDFTLAGGAGDNQNPNFSPDSITLSGEPWPEFAPPAGDCKGSGLRELSVSSGEQPLRITLPATAREDLQQASSADAARETLTLSHVASAGDFSSAFSVIGETAADTAADFSWKPPSDPAPNGTLVRFWFVVRDGRSGSDFTERALCVVP